MIQENYIQCECYNQQENDDFDHSPDFQDYSMDQEGYYKDSEGRPVNYKNDLIF